MIIDYKLTYPSGTATAHLINSFHTPEGAKLANYTSWDVLSNHLVETIFTYGLQSGILYKWTTRSFDNCRKQVKVLGKFFSFSFLWSFFQWFYTAAEDICGFAKFPTFGLQAFNNRCKEWYMIFFLVWTYMTTLFDHNILKICPPFKKWWPLRILWMLFFLLFQA